jgi:predicted DNA-binding transcriptional regulator AlpA
MNTRKEGRRKMVNVGKAAKAVGLSRQSIYRYIDRGLVPIDVELYRKHGVVRVDLEAVKQTAERLKGKRERCKAEKQSERAEVATAAS